MKLSRIIRTTPIRRLKLALIPLLVVDLILAPISIWGKSPPLKGVITVNILVVFILLLKFGSMFFWKRLCRACGKTLAKDTGEDDHGFPVVRCPRCGGKWIL